MKTPIQNLPHLARLVALALLTILNFPLSTFAQGTAFTYQGRLSDGTNPASGSYDLAFSVWNAASGQAQVGGNLTNANTTVSNGFFTATLDFGANFPGANRWLEIAVRTNGGGAFTTLTPRQPITAAPYAITAGDVTGANISRLNVPDTATGATGVPTVSFGSIVNATVTSGGSGYLTPPNVMVQDLGLTGSGADITASISGGVVTGLVVQNPGSDYSANVILTIETPESNGFQTFVSPNFFTGVNTMNNLANSFAGTFTGNGAGLALDASQLVGGTVADARLSANVPLLNGSPTFAGTVTAASFSGPVVSSVNALKDNVILQAGSNVTISASGNTLTIASAGAGGSSIWSVLNNNAYYNAGNVGIGTTTPSAYGHGGTAKILEVNNSGTAANSQAHLMLYSGVNSLLDSAMGTVTWAQPGGMAAYIGAQTRSTTPNAPAAMLSFGTRKIGDGAASPKMVITEEGNVGIGTTTPASKLTVSGSGYGLEHNNGTVRLGTYVDSSGGWLGTRSNDKLKFFVNNGVLPSMTVDTTGNVGIGTTSPFSKLEVAGDAQINGRLNVNIGGSGNVTMKIQARSGDNLPFMVIDSSGGSFFHLASGTPNELVLSGNAYKSSGGTSWGTFSDRRLKQDVRAFEPGLNEVLQLRPVRFHYRDDPKRGLTSTHEEVGFIAQEVREVIPDAVTEGQDGYLTLKADPIHWAAINAIQELNTKLEEQRAENAELKQRLEKLEQRMNQNHGGAK